MLQIVIDTNVLVAAMRSNRGASFRLLNQLGSLNWQPNVTVALLLEYEYVLKRDCGEFGLTEEDIDDFLMEFSLRAELNRQYFLWRPVATDPDDDLVLEAAIASQSDFIVTFNKRDFPESTRFGIFCLTPKEFFIMLERPI